LHSPSITCEEETSIFRMIARYHFAGAYDADLTDKKKKEIFIVRCFDTSGDAMISKSSNSQLKRKSRFL